MPKRVIKLNKCLLTRATFVGVLFTQILSAPEWVTDIITECADTSYAVEESVLAAFAWICVANGNDQQQQQQGCGDVFDLRDVVKLHAENTTFY